MSSSYVKFIRCALPGFAGIVFLLLSSKEKGDPGKKLACLLLFRQRAFFAPAGRADIV
jgi:hypothetical protein